MCHLCGTDEEKVKGREHEKQLSKELERMAMYCRLMSTGELNPHSDAMIPVTGLAKHLIRELMADYF
jgi:hypothetical protein